MSEGTFHGRNVVDYRERCRLLEQVIGVEDGKVDAVRRAFPGMTPDVALFLSMLLKRDFVTRPGFYAVKYAGRPDREMPDEDKANQLFDRISCNLRAFLDPLGVTIQTARSAGWLMAKPDRAKIKALVDAAPAADLEECARLTDARNKRLALLDGS